MLKSNLSTTIKAVAGNKNGKWIGIEPFAAHEGKIYPLSLMQEVIKKLTRTKPHTILLFGGGDKEIEKLKNIENHFPNQVITIAGKLSFAQELDLISNLDLMLSMDSGNGHLAANYGMPVITLWGVTHPFSGFAPFGQPKENMLLADREAYPLIPTSVYGNKYPTGYEKAITSISSDMVVKKIQQLL